MKLLKYKLSELNSIINHSYDLFICSTSFEIRSSIISKNLEKQRIKRAMIFTNIAEKKVNYRSRKKLTEIFTQKNEVVNVSTEDPIFTADGITKAIQTELILNNPRSILVDVTTFNHEILLILLKILQRLSDGRPVSVVYTNASDYSIGDSIDFKWLSRGITEVRSVLGYPGEINPALKTHLIIIVGYEHERASSIIEVLEPNTIALGCGKPSSMTTEKHHYANLHFSNLVNEVAFSYSNVNRFKVFCDDPVTTYSELQKQIDEIGKANIILAPMNNKLTTLAAAWIGFHNPRVQICYAPAIIYNYKNYSNPGYHFYFIKDIYKKHLEK